MTKLAITADDLGMSVEVSRGILEAHRTGVVRSTSLLVTYADSEAGCSQAQAEPDLEVGLHLDLVGGRPVSDPSQIRALVDREGRFHPLPAFSRRLFMGRIPASQIALEVRAQAARARTWGLAPLAWDSHRHVHAMPPVARIVGPVAKAEGVRWLRRPAPPRAWRTSKARLLGVSSALSAPFYKQIPGNDWYVDLSSWTPADVAAIALLRAYGGVGEIGTHPGCADDEGLARQSELELLTDPLLAAALGPGAVSWRVA